MDYYRRSSVENTTSRSSREPNPGRKGKKTSFWFSFLFFPISFLFMEWTSKLYLFGFTADIGWLYTALIAVFSGFLVMYLLCFLPKKARFTVAAVVLGAVAALYSFHMIYYAFFQFFFSFQDLGLANAITDFWRGTLSAIVNNFYKALTMFVPFALLLVIRRTRFRFFKTRSKTHKKCGLIALGLAVVLLFSILVPTAPRKAFTQMNQDPAATFQTYGIGLSTWNNLFSTVFGTPDEDIDNPYADYTDTDITDPTEDPENPGVIKPIYGYNVLNINFPKLINEAPNDKIRKMHEYFSSVPASQQNEYTGMFKGKNLIVLCLEGFSYKAIDPQLTPTLYKMYHEGFCFTNFYDSLWGGSTATGEYANMTGNFYNSATCLKKSASCLEYSSFGNLFKNAGYACRAYHNHTYTYYSRDISHPNFGYDYKGVGNGLKFEYNGWPRSDLELSQVTAAEYIEQYKKDGIPFHTYYMTVSGHCNYSYEGNNMSKRHRDLVENLGYCDNVCAYFGCQYEVELMLNDLIAKLTDAGILDDTVFAMCCDHFPYAMSDAELAELYGLPEKDIRNNFDLYRNAFFLWSSCMEEPVIVDTPCSSYDMVPTVANLFGLKFDSRIITGKDVLSTTENIVFINTLDTAGSWNWITTQGTYYVKSGEFVPSASCTLTGDALTNYVTKTKAKANAMRAYSLEILNQDYYSYIFNKDFTLKAALDSGS